MILTLNVYKRNAIYNFSKHAQMYISTLLWRTGKYSGWDIAYHQNAFAYRTYQDSRNRPFHLEIILMLENWQNRAIFVLAFIFFITFVYSGCRYFQWKHTSGLNRRLSIKLCCSYKAYSALDKYIKRSMWACLLFLIIFTATCTSLAKKGLAQASLFLLDFFPFCHRLNMSYYVKTLMFANVIEYFWNGRCLF